MEIRASHETFPLSRPFAVSRGSRTGARVLTERAERDGAVGRGECVPYGRYGETVESVAAQIGSLPEGATRKTLLAPGAARMAVDRAPWDHVAKAQGVPVWQLAGLASPGPLTTAAGDQARHAGRHAAP